MGLGERGAAPRRDADRAAEDRNKGGGSSTNTRKGGGQRGHLSLPPTPSSHQTTTYPPTPPLPTYPPPSPPCTVAPPPSAPPQEGGRHIRLQRDHTRHTIHGQASRSLARLHPLETHYGLRVEGDQGAERGTAEPQHTSTRTSPLAPHPWVEGDQGARKKENAPSCSTPDSTHTQLPPPAVSRLG
eukprot:scaffold7743_cov105-Isochrysis_galbana.AAC.4